MTILPLMSMLTPLTPRNIAHLSFDTTRLQMASPRLHLNRLPLALVVTQNIPHFSTKNHFPPPKTTFHHQNLSLHTLRPPLKMGRKLARTSPLHPRLLREERVGERRASNFP